MAYLVTEDFRVSNPVTREFKRGTLLADGPSVTMLLEGHAPIVEVDLDDLVQCPYCKLGFVPCP